MILDVRPRTSRPSSRIFRRHDVPATAVGTVTAGPDEEVRWKATPAARLRLAFRVDPPLLTRPRRRAPRERAEPRRSRTTTSRRSPRRCFSRRNPSPGNRSSGSTTTRSGAGPVVLPFHGRVETPATGTRRSSAPGRRVGEAIAATVASQPWACREDAGPGRRVDGGGGRPQPLRRRGPPRRAHRLPQLRKPGRPAGDGRLRRRRRRPREGGEGARAGGPQRERKLLQRGDWHRDPAHPGAVRDRPRRRPPARGHVRPSSGREPLYLVGRSSPRSGGSLYARRRDSSAGFRSPRPIRRSSVGSANGSSARWRAAGSAPRTTSPTAGSPSRFRRWRSAEGSGSGRSLDATGLFAPGRGALVAEGASRWVVEVAADAARCSSARCVGWRSGALGEVTEGGGEFLWRAKSLARSTSSELYGRWRAGLDGLGRR